MSEDVNNRILLITGPAGAGRSTAIHALEDIGFEAIDNLPMTLLERVLSGDPIDHALAIGVDTRTRGFAVPKLIEMLDRSDLISVELVYLDCASETLLRRFNETRRRHPAAPTETPEVGIRRELDLLTDLRNRADILIDTSDLSPHDLKAQIGRLFDHNTANRLTVSVQSFSYKRGTPQGVDMIIDCRFLQNPHWQKDLRAMTGMNQPVVDYVQADALYEPFINQLQAMCELLLPAYQKEGKAYFSVGLGCSGGRHRSVTVAENLAKALAQNNWQVSIRHRELERQTESLTSKEIRI